MANLPPSVAQSLAATKVDYRLLGNSGLRVSVPIVGCMSIGNPEWADWVIGPEKALPLLKAAYDRGVTTVMTSLQENSGDLTANFIKVGYGKHLLEWRFRAHHRAGDQGVQFTPPQTRYHDQGVELRGRRAVPRISDPR
jgi:hypothetical protein